MLPNADNVISNTTSVSQNITSGKYVVFAAISSQGSLKWVKTRNNIHYIK